MAVIWICAGFAVLDCGDLAGCLWVFVWVEASLVVCWFDWFVDSVAVYVSGVW